MAQDPKYDEQGNRQPPNNWLAVFGGVSGLCSSDMP